MATETATTDGGETDEQDGLREAYDRVADALGVLSLSEHTDQWIALQRRYHDLKAALLARDPDHQAADLPGTRINVPNTRLAVVDNPTVADETGEWEIPTRRDTFRVLDGVTVAGPTNPHTTHAVTVDHVIETDGAVRVEVNATALDDLPGGD